MRTYSQKPTDVARRWYVLDASTVSMGRVATTAASLLIGKGKPTVTAHVDGGDFVIIINAASLVATGNKSEGKLYHDYSGYPSGLRTRKLRDVKPEEAIYRSVRGMLPDNKLRDARLRRLKIYAAAEHEHSAQKPEVYEIKRSR